MISATEPAPIPKARLPKLGGRRLCVAGICAIVAFGFAAVAYGYWPGVMIDDARWQYQQAVDNAYEDWHPPLMAWIWRRLTFVQPGPGPMLLLQLALYWGGIALIASSAYRRGRPCLGLALACAGLLPAALALTGTVTKDCLMTGALVCASGFLLWRELAGSPRRQALLAALAWLGLFVAAALRLNAVFACAPLALAALPRTLIRTKLRLTIATLLCCTAMLATGPIFARFVQAEDTDVQLSLITFDLGGITEYSGHSQFPDLGVRDPVAANHGCYDPYQWDSYSDWAAKPCPVGFDAIQNRIDEGDVDARELWVKAILSHPLAYSEHRLAHFNRSSWFLVAKDPDPPGWTQSVPNPWGFRVLPNRVLAAVDAIANASAHTPFGWPVFWISVALAILVAGRNWRASPATLAIAASACFYGAGFLFVGVATGIRYYMWTMTGAAIAAILVLAELIRQSPPNWSKTVPIPALIVLVPTAMAVASRLVLK